MFVRKVEGGPREGKIEILLDREEAEIVMYMAEGGFEWGGASDRQAAVAVELSKQLRNVQNL